MSTDILPAVADEATIRARLEEAAVAYALPEPARVRCVVKRDDSWCTSDEMRARVAGMAPLLLLDAATEADFRAWAAHLNFEAMTEVREYAPESSPGRVYRETKAGGDWLGWTVSLSLGVDGTEFFHAVAASTTTRLARKAHEGWLL